MELTTSNTVHLDLANFFVYVGGKKLEKENTAVDVKPINRQQHQALKKLKSCLRLIRQGYNVDGGDRIGIKVFYISPANWNTLKGVMLFLHHQEANTEVQLKYKVVELISEHGVKDDEVHGDG